MKVRRKIFVFLGPAGAGRMTVKLEESHAHALSIEGAEWTGYGLGASGWVDGAASRTRVEHRPAQGLGGGELPDRGAESGSWRHSTARRRPRRVGPSTRRTWRLVNRLLLGFS